MKHIEETRIVELSLDLTASPLESETIHLRECTDCAARLDLERKFTASLQAMQGEPVPTHFQKHVEIAFSKAHSFKKSLKPSLMVAFGIASLLTSAMLWLIIMNPAAFTTAAAMAFAKTVTLFEALTLVVERVPFATEAITVTSIATVLMAMVLLGAISRRVTVEVR